MARRFPHPKSRASSTRRLKLAALQLIALGAFLVVWPYVLPKMIWSEMAKGFLPVGGIAIVSGIVLWMLASARMRGAEAVVDLDALRGNLAVARHVVPRVGHAELVRSWAAIVNGTADWKPIIGEAPGHRGFFFNLFPWTGFTAGPISAQVISELILGRKPCIDIARLSALGIAA